METKVVVELWVLAKVAEVGVGSEIIVVVLELW